MNSSPSKGEGLWRRDRPHPRNGNLYPTHGLGPVANYMGIQRGDRFDYVVSMSTPQRGLDEYRKAHVDLGRSPLGGALRHRRHEHLAHQDRQRPDHHPQARYVSNPHPYDRINVIAGTKGVFADYPPRIYFDGQGGRRGLGQRSTGLEGAPAPAMEEGRRDRQETRRPRRHGLHHALPPVAMHARGTRSRHGCLRCRRVVRARPAQPASPSPTAALQ